MPVALSPSLPLQQALPARYRPSMPAASLPDAQAEVAALRARDPAAFERLVRQESERLYRVIYRVVRDADEAQSLVQETFLQAFLAIQRFRGEARVSSWLCSIGLNLAFQALRKARRAPACPPADVDLLQPCFDGRGSLGETQRWDPAETAMQAERSRLVREAIDRLPETHRTIVLLRDIEAYSTTEVARMLGLTEGNVRVRLHRARNALRTLLAPYFTDSTATPPTPSP